jgi:hypothetical protein
MRARSAPLLVVAAAALLLAGCAGTSGSTEEPMTGSVSDSQMIEGQVAEGGAPAVAGELGAPEAVGTGSTSVAIDRQVVRTGYVSMRVEDVTKSAFQVHALVKKRNGLIAAEDTQGSGDTTYANITAQIPADALDAFIAEVTALGTVDTINVTAQDVTTQVVDLDARIKALQTSVDRMTQLLAQASRIEDLLAIETQLSQRQAELDSLKAQRSALGDAVAMSTLTVSLSPTTQVTEVDAPGFLSGLASGWSALVSVAMVAITVVGFLLPFLLILALVAIPIVIVVVRQTRRHRRTRRSAPTEPAPTEPAASLAEEAPERPVGAGQP